MKNQPVKLFCFILIFASVLSACDDSEVTHRYPQEVQSFFKNVQVNPITVDGIKLGDSWRLIREQASYNDGDFQKEFNYDLLNDPEHNQYKEYWVFDTDKLLMVSEGERFEKNWDGYYEFFDQVTDIPNKLLTIDYVYDGGDKQYTRYWTITTLTETELVLTDENAEEEYFYQYTFKREKFKQ